MEKAHPKGRIIEVPVYSCEICQQQFKVSDLRLNGQLDYHQDPNKGYRDCQGVGTDPTLRMQLFLISDPTKTNKP